MCETFDAFPIGLKPFPKQALVFMGLQYKSFENTEGKGEIARNKQFLIFPQCFLPILRTFYHFHQVWNCRLLTPSLWKCLKFVVWERVNPNNTSFIQGYDTFENIAEKKEILITHIFLYSYGVFQKHHISAMSLSPTTKFQTSSNWNYLQTTK